jgi:hypothetical protein
MARSDVRSGKNGEAEWIVRMNDGREIQLGGLTGRASQLESYRRHAQELGAFIADRAQPTFVAQYQGVGGLSLPVSIGMLLATGWLFFALLHGWRTTLTFDRAAGTLTIVRRPALWSSPRALPLSSVARVDARAGRLWVLFASLPTLTLRLYDDKGKVLFTRRQITSDDARREIEAVNEVLTARREAGT